MARAAPQQFASFADFYPFYLSEHANLTSRRLHLMGTVLFIAQWLLAIVTANAWLVLSGPISGYAFAWVGHFFFERNRPATFHYPLYSLIGDFAMARDILRGRVPI
jgi:hypothetical protein